MLDKYFFDIIMVVLVTIAGILGNAALKIYRRYVDDPTKESVAMDAALFVEQVWGHLHGYDKLMKALETAREMLEKKGIAFDKQEMTILIEAAVAEFNDAFNKDYAQQPEEEQEIDGIVAEAMAEAKAEAFSQEEESYF